MDAEKERQFWRKFHQKTIAYHVPSPARPWYRRHAERYISAHSGLRLAAHSPDTVSSYLDDLGRQGHLRDWQFRQAVEALKILFCEMVKVPWARDFAWSDWMDRARILPPSHHIEVGTFVRSRKTRRLPVVLSRDEVRCLLNAIEAPTYRLLAELLYGCGMRLMEAVRLRVFDVDFSNQYILVRRAKGDKDRMAPLPRRLVADLQRQVDTVKELHVQDCAAGFGEVFLPEP